MDRNRRKTLTTLAGGAAAVGLLGPAVISRAAEEAKPAAADKPEIKPAAKVLNEKGQVVHQPLPYVRLDPERVAELAYDNYYKGDCMYGVFTSIVEALAEKVGEPYASYPTTVTRYGAGGVLGWATLCGAANGSAMAIYLVSKEPMPLIDEMYNYCQVTALPDYTPKKAKFKIAQSVSGSTLCHVSVTRWCAVSGAKAFSPERAERCGHLVASVAKKTVEVLNAQFDGQFKAAFPIPDEVKACRACHDQKGTLENTRGKMACGSCHDEKHPEIN
jgi:hypothetical protein